MPGPNAPIVKRLSAIVVGFAIAGFGLYALDNERPAPVVAPPPVVEKPVAKIVKALPKPQPPLERWDIVGAASLAADAYAAGQTLPEANKALVGRNFTLRIPFGCDGPLPDKERKPQKSAKAELQPVQTGWRYTESNRALQLVFGIEDWTKADWIGSLAGDTPRDRVEGVWLDRPWTRAETCPVRATTEQPDETVPPPARLEQVLGIAQFFEQDASRNLQRGGRPYSATVKRDGPPEPGSYFLLVVEGRIASYSDGQPVHCRASAPDRRPACLVATEIATVAFENPITGEQLARWTK